MSDFFGKVIAITGGASGIGLALAELLISKGCIVSIADADRSALHHAVLDIEKAFPGTSDKVLPVELDVRKPGAVDIWLKDTVDRFGRLDGAANLAGVTPKPANGHPIRELDDKDWDTLIAVNLTGLKNCVKSELGLMQSGASIVNASSVAGLRGQHNYTAYSVTKAGVIALTKCAAKEEGPRGIRINAIAPYVVTSPKSTLQSCCVL